MSDKPLCEICGEPMSDGEEMFKYHGYSCNCPKPPLEKVASSSGGSVSCEAHRPDIEVLEKAIQKCKEIDTEEIRKIFYSTFPADFLDGFISALEEKIKELSVR